MAFDGRLLGGISVLAAVVETGNFVRAAEALGLTQSGISRAVARLEARVGVRLLDRTPRAVSLTDEGRRPCSSRASAGRIGGGGVGGFRRVTRGPRKAQGECRSVVCAIGACTAAVRLHRGASAAVA
jgi:hypothetical protein